MTNKLFVLIKMSRIPVTRLAEMAGVSRNTISPLIATDEMPRNVRLSTLDQIAQGLGYRVEVDFVPNEEGQNG